MSLSQSQRPKVRVVKSPPVVKTVTKEVVKEVLVPSDPIKNENDIEFISFDDTSVFIPTGAFTVNNLNIHFPKFVEPGLYRKGLNYIFTVQGKIADVSSVKTEFDENSGKYISYLNIFEVISPRIIDDLNDIVTLWFPMTKDIYPKLANDFVDGIRMVYLQLVKTSDTETDAFKVDDEVTGTVRLSSSKPF
jgi:hypothetical protein